MHARGRCRFDFLKSFAEETTSADDAYPHYARREYRQFALQCACVIAIIVAALIVDAFVFATIQLFFSMQ